MHDPRPSRRALLKGVSALAVVAATGPARTRPRAVDPFIDRLLARMSLADKAGQLSIYGAKAHGNAAGVRHRVRLCANRVAGEGACRRLEHQMEDVL